MQTHCDCTPPPAFTMQTESCQPVEFEDRDEQSERVLSPPATKDHQWPNRSPLSSAAIAYLLRQSTPGALSPMTKRLMTKRITVRLPASTKVSQLEAEDVDTKCDVPLTRPDIFPLANAEKLASNAKAERAAATAAKKTTGAAQDEDCQRARGRLRVSLASAPRWWPVKASR